MNIALDINGDRTSAWSADYTGDYYCQTCSESLILKRGEIRKPHFAHKGGAMCQDHWHYDMSDWHFWWQEQFPIECQEVVFEKSGEKHRADIFIDNTVIEFQHSNISYDDFRARNRFYNSLGYKVVWLFDVRDNPPEVRESRRPLRDGDMFEWKRPRRALRGFNPKESKVEVYLQPYESEILEGTQVVFKDMEPEDWFDVSSELWGVIIKVDWISPRGFYRFISNHWHSEAEFIEQYIKLPYSETISE